MTSLAEQWEALMGELGVAPPTARAVYCDLVRRYGGDGRHYHTLDHIQEMLERVTELAPITRDLTSIRLAVWFHDIIYEPSASDNEAQSAMYAAWVLGALGIRPSLVARVMRLILATKGHESAPGEIDFQILLDADLAALGASPDVFRRNSDAIRQEYAVIPDGRYREERRALMRAFLGRDRLFQTDQMYERFEAAARRNLRAELEVMKA